MIRIIPFGKKQKGKRAFNEVLKKIIKIGIEWHLWDEDDNGKYREINFCGPGTSLEKRVYPKGHPKQDQPRPESQPINSLDWACWEHDLAYRDHQDDIKVTNKADERLAAAANSVLSNPGVSWRRKGTARLVLAVMKTKSKLQV